ncbi:putative WRKY transcription factor 13 [Sesamum alatum]|uniref:WRKY transcription factor 13 n=1 Tax=Sesamum alatum TaxID=300844 RepID=A0AAE1XIX1_9LAMI|nr:putative WRKY transcription factor 13 [Sesamum alatum]
MVVLDHLSPSFETRSQHTSPSSSITKLLGPFLLFTSNIHCTRLMDDESFQAFNTLKHEVSKGMEQVKQLKAASSGEQEKVLERMLASHEEVLSILNGIAAAQGQTLSEMVIQASSDGPDSEISVCDVQSEISSQVSKPPRRRGLNKRRRTLFTKTVTTSGSYDDDYGWRKYGQKVILNAQHPRNYFRCLYKYQGCSATKQVQRILDNPPTYQTTYYGQHTCSSSVPVHKAAP